MCWLHPRLATAFGCYMNLVTYGSKHCNNQAYKIRFWYQRVCSSLKNFLISLLSQLTDILSRTHFHCLTFLPKVKFTTLQRVNYRLTYNLARRGTDCWHLCLNQKMAFWLILRQQQRQSQQQVGVCSGVILINDYT